MNKALSVIIPSKEINSDLKNCIFSVINSVIKAEKEKETEIIVATHKKNASREKLIPKNSCLRIIYGGGDYPLNPSQARNIGIKKAEGKILAFIDADCIAEENWVSQIFEGFKKIKNNPSVDCIQGDYWTHLSKNEDLWSKLYSEYRKRHALEHIRKYQNYFITERLDGRNFAIQAALAKKFLFNEDLKKGQDREFGQRLTKHGYKIMFVNEMLVYHNPLSLKEIISKEFNYGTWAIKWREIKFWKVVKWQWFKGEISLGLLLITLISRSSYELGKLYGYLRNKFNKL